MQQSSRELWLSFLAILFITILYLFVVISLGSIPAASEFFGHSLGVVGFVLMLLTETLYSWRKRSRSARWGRMSSWLQIHIFMGLVGPYLVLLHSSWKFNGLAGIVMLLTVIIVVSGVIGRYIYTSVPRSADGIELEAGELERRIQVSDAEMQQWLATRPAALKAISQRLASDPALSSSGSGLIIGRVFQDWGYWVRWWNEKRRLEAPARTQAKHLESLLSRQRALRRQLRSLVMARRMLGLWHAIHIPIGMALFTAAFIHVIASIYYATLLH